MTDDRPSEDDHLAATRRTVLAAALPHVAFDGWSDRTLAHAVEDAGVEPGLARLAFPRGGVDLALAFHNDRDAALAADLASADLLGLRFRDRIGYAIMRRLELVADEREAVLRGAALFALPIHAADGARAIWHTADTIWTALGDESRDFSWYSKRTTLSAVYSAALLYWLGDDTPGFAATREFVGRRIDDVMRIEGVKSRIRGNPLAAAMLKGPQAILDRVRAPGNTPPPDMPGSWRRGG
jgi:ubiquinone biosynthesis protein COQ9